MSDEPVTVATVQGAFNADLIKGLLESTGIPCALRYESYGKFAQLTLDGLGQVEVQVPAEYAAAARELLAAEVPGDLAEIAFEAEPPPDDVA